MIIITGASDGLGQELAKIYLDNGYKVIGLSRNACIDGVEHIKTDLRDKEAINQAIKKINSLEEPIQALINCAGVLSIEKVDSISAAELDKTLETNVRAPILLTSGLLAKIKREGGDIVNVASTVGLKAYADQAAYGASKWAIRGFSANLQVELKNTACRVISFCPGGFKSKLFVKATGIDNTEDGSEWMKAADLASLIKSILDLPKNMEVSEIVVNRRAG